MPFNVVVGGFQNNNIWTYNKNLQMRGLQSSYKCEIPKQKKKNTKKHIWMQTWTVMQTWKCDKGSKSHAPHPPPWTHKKVEQEMLSSLHSKPHVHTKRIWRGESVALHKSACSQNPKSKHIKGSKEHYLLGQNTTCKFWGVIPFIKLQTET